MRGNVVRLLAAALPVFCATPAGADKNLTWVGTVTAANSKQVNVHGNGPQPNPKPEDQIFLIGGGFGGVYAGGQKHTTQYLKKGMFVRVAYRQASLFGANYATQINVLQSHVSIPIAAPSGSIMLPAATPAHHSTAPSPAH